MMKSYKFGDNGRKKWSKILLFACMFIGLMVIAAIIGVKTLYEQNLKPVDQNSDAEVAFVVDSGDTVALIAANLKSKDLIRSEHAFNQYVRSNQLGESFIAGTYSLKQSYDVETIVDYLITGKVDTALCTILPGQTIDQIKQHFQDKCGFSEVDVIAGFKLDNFKDHPALVDKPKNAGLDGYLYPDSYELVSGTKVATIIEQSLDEMAETLSPDIRQGITNQGLSVYEGINLAAIVENEVTGVDPSGKPNNDRPKVAQVFIKRLNEGIKLESNATDELSAEYDTYSIEGLPPAPITNVSLSSLKAVASPANTNYLYFVSGCDGITRFSETFEKHQAYINAHGVNDTASCN